MPWIKEGMLLMKCVLMLVHVCTGALECMCTTPECQHAREYLCHAETLCYVQYTPGTVGGAPEGVVRGCIDGRTPLLCENQRPDFYSGAWPVMYCCRSPLCNKDVMPTAPDWLVDSQVTPTRTTPTSTPPNDKGVNEGERPTPSFSPPQYTTSNVWKVNPLYVGVPLAGACMLAAISVFAVYILRRQNQVFQQECLRTRALKRRPAAVMPPRCQGGCHGVPCHYVTMVTKGAQSLPRCQAGCVYVDSDVSSSGSESRLLAHV